MDVDEQGVSKLATLFKMRSVPTIAYIKPGGEYTLSVGALPETTLKERIRTTFEL
jgi:thioredoxin-like negative regulator of GroEL